MRALVIYESMFGNTERVAQSIASGIASSMEVQCVEVGAAPIILDADIGLLVVGGPTHAFGMSRPSTRASAAEQAVEPLHSQRIGVREWLDMMEPPTHDVAAAGFDTHMEHPRIIAKAGSAARPIARALRRSGCTMLGEAVHFWVEESLGPLRDGELERARDWGVQLATAAAPARSASARSFAGPYP